MVDVFQHLGKVVFRRGFNGALDAVVLRDAERDSRRDADEEEASYGVRVAKPPLWEGGGCELIR